MTLPTAWVYGLVVDWIDKLISCIKEIGFGPGVVGRTAQVMLGVLFVLGILAYRADGHWLMIGLAILVVVAGLGYVFYITRWASKNRYLALTEGIHTVQMEQLSMAAQGLSFPSFINVTPASIIADPQNSAPPKLIEENPKQTQVLEVKPDES